jgi:hypothetical protein
VQATTYEFVPSGPFHALTARICLTSAGNSTPCNGQHVPANGVRDVQVLGQGGIPASGVSAVVFDLAAVPALSSRTSWPFRWSQWKLWVLGSMLEATG